MNMIKSYFKNKVKIVVFIFGMSIIPFFGLSASDPANTARQNIALLGADAHQEE